METNWKEEMISFNTLAKAGSIFFSVFLWLDVKTSIIYEQTREETICKTWTPRLYVSGIDLPDLVFFSSMLFSPTIIKKPTQWKRSRQQDQPFLWKKLLLTSGTQEKPVKKEKTGLAHMWGRVGGQLLLDLLSWTSQLNLHVWCKLRVSEALECTPDLQGEVNPWKELHLDPGAPRVSIQMQSGGKQVSSIV